MSEKKVYPIQPILEDPAVNEIMIDGYEHVYIERGGKLEDIPSPFESESQLLEMIDEVLASCGLRADESNPIVDARLADGSRFNVVMRPIAINGPHVTLRKMFIGKLDEDDLIRFGAVSEPMMRFLRACIRARMNILVSGGTASGKTTVLTILARMIPDDERIVLLQSDEVILDKPRLARLETRPANLDGRGQVSMQDLVTNAMRMRPDRIVTTEVHGAEVLDLIQGMNNGHDGCLQSIHADSVYDALSRLELMVGYANPALPTLTVRGQIASAFDLVVQTNRLKDGRRRLVKISEVTGVSEGVVTTRDIFEFRQTGLVENRIAGYFSATGNIPGAIKDLQDVGVDLPLSIFTPSDTSQ